MTERIIPTPLEERRNHNANLMLHLIESPTTPDGYKEGWKRMHLRFRNALTMGVSLAYAPKTKQELLTSIEAFQDEMREEIDTPMENQEQILFQPAIPFAMAAPRIINPSAMAQEKQYAAAYLRRLNRITEETPLDKAREETAIVAAQAYLTAAGASEIVSEDLTGRLKTLRLFTRMVLSTDKQPHWLMPVDPPKPKEPPKTIEERTDDLLDAIDQVL
jgi:hypothetical protein